MPLSKGQRLRTCAKRALWRAATPCSAARSRRWRCHSYKTTGWTLQAGCAQRCAAAARGACSTGSPAASPAASARVAIPQGRKLHAIPHDERQTGGVACAHTRAPGLPPSQTHVAAEGPAVFRHAGRHYVFTSHLTGWDPNPPMLFVSEAGGLCSSDWRLLPRPSHGPRANTTYDSQVRGSQAHRPAVGSYCCSASTKALPLLQPPLRQLLGRLAA